MLGLVYLFCYFMVTSRFGRVLMAARDNENRLRFLGYNLVSIKVLVFAISAAIAAIAGILYVPQVGIISPSNMGVIPSIEIVIWVAVGGRGTLLGAIIGALLVNYGRSYFSESYPAIWQYFMGALFIGSVLLFPAGIVGTIQHFANRLSRKWGSERTSAAIPETSTPDLMVGIQPSQAKGQS
jgi:urea transport system permease protein